MLTRNKMRFLSHENIWVYYIVTLREYFYCILPQKNEWLCRNERGNTSLWYWFIVVCAQCSAPCLLIPFFVTFSEQESILCLLWQCDNVWQLYKHVLYWTIWVMLRPLCTSIVCLHWFGSNVSSTGTVEYTILPRP